jgi:tyrosine-protein phosphatase SIW14
VHSFGIEGNKEPFVGIDDEQLEKALLCALDTRHQPLLVHCNKGKHRTGCFVGILRRIAGHSLASAFAEYRQFLGATFISRDLDRLCIETFDVDRFKRTLEKLVPQEFRPDWIA